MNVSAGLAPYPAVAGGRCWITRDLTTAAVRRLPSAIVHRPLPRDAHAGRRMGSESKKTASRHTTEAETGTHRFEVVGYTLNKGIGIGNFIRSGTFSVGGSDRSIRFYPDGSSDGTRESVSVYLELMSKNVNVRASYFLSLVNQTTGSLVTMLSETTARAFGPSRSNSTSALIMRNKLESKATGFIVDNFLTIECSVTVIKESQVSDITGDLQIDVPPSDLSEHFGKLLLEQERADVAFSVGGENFPAHKIVLATRSPVFNAELYGSMKERRARRVTVEDMQPDVFKALLHFIYTDSLPDSDWNDLDDNMYCEIIRHLLVAADRYALDRLKLLCASRLVEYLGTENVAITLALADQHNCERLKDVCIEFMASSGVMEAVVATQGYGKLKRACPSILVDVLEKASKYHKT